MHFGGNSHYEFPAVGPVGNRFRRRFIVAKHILDDVATSDRIPEKASSRVDASQLREGNSAHSPTFSSSSADQVTL